MTKEKAKEAFEAYLSDFDQTDGMIRLKREHSYRVADNAEALAQSLSMGERDCDFAWVLGLVHDIGRFYQAEKYHSFLDYKTLDHGDLGAEILKKDWKKYVDEDQKDLLITAVKNHNKYEIEAGLNGRQLIFAKLIRDADKVDILYLRGLHSYDGILHIPVKEIEQEDVSPEIFNAILSSHQVISAHRKNALDRVVSMPALIFDLNYDWSKRKVLERDDIHKILSLYHYQNPDGKRHVEEIEAHCTMWLKEQVQK